MSITEGIASFKDELTSNKLISDLVYVYLRKNCD